MPDYKTPGVYIEEISTLPASVAAVATAIPAFIGHTDKAGKRNDPEELRGEPTRITSMLDYIEIFGGPNPEELEVTVTDTYTGTDGEEAEMIDRKIEAKLPGTISNYKMYYALQMFFNNGGGPCYVVSVNDYDNAVDPGNDTTPTSLIGGLTRLAKYDEPTLIVFPDQLGIADYKDVYEAALTQCRTLRDRFVIMDVKEVTDDPIADAGTFRNDGIGKGNLKYGAVYYPYLKTSLSYGYHDSEDESLEIERVYVYEGTGTPNPPIPTNGNENLFDISENDPSLYRSITAELSKLRVDLAPSAAIAGIYARVDRQRGVWKAPANVDVRSVVGPTLKVSHAQQETLNVDAGSGKSINAIRTFTGKGTLVWGARTLAGNDNEWRYIPVRRLYIFVEESVKKATEFVVFEPNTANTWLRVKSMIENFLSKLWRDGALAGAKPEEAFFVRVGLGQTMNAIDILEGRMNVEIGLAAVRPAEFIILKFSHKLQES
ncbi:phage tail sheath family protein [Rhodohalobacter sp. 8-1]|uniref:phage tail sheath family protein n=1 Tax=Rhodohalobacter sp. 8-1 TaxID=3131972 RepID=UPI0030EB5BA5